MSLSSVAFQQSSASAAAAAAAAATAAANSAAAGLTSAASTSTSASGSSSSGSSSSGSSASSGTSSSSSGTGAALGTLSSNFSSFLNLLMTQLKNQDPTSPLDTNQFTSELVQFSQVEQQINTNTSLTQLIQLTQGGDLTQASAMLGSQVTAQASEIPLQNGKGSISFTAQSAEPVAIAIYNSAGQQIKDASMQAAAGQNSWTWDGTDNSGNSVPDGAYKLAVIGGNANGSTSALPFDVIGTATGVQSANNSLTLNLGALSIPYSAIQSVSKSGG